MYLGGVSWAKESCEGPHQVLCSLQRCLKMGAGDALPRLFDVKFLHCDERGFIKIGDGSSLCKFAREGSLWVSNRPGTSEVESNAQTLFSGWGNKRIGNLTHRTTTEDPPFSPMSLSARPDRPYLQKQIPSNLDLKPKCSEQEKARLIERAFSMI